MFTTPVLHSKANETIPPEFATLFRDEYIVEMLVRDAFRVVAAVNEAVPLETASYTAPVEHHRYIRYGDTGAE